MTEIRKSVLRTVRLDDDVWAAVKSMDCSLNHYLRLSLLDASGEKYRDVTAKREPLPALDSDYDPREIPGISVGMPPQKEATGGFPCRCVHSGCRGSKFTGRYRGENLCPDCRERGHAGEPRGCQSCTDDSSTGAL